MSWNLMLVESEMSQNVHSWHVIYKTASSILQYNVVVQQYASAKNMIVLCILTILI